MGPTSPTALVSRRHKVPNGASGRAKAKVATLRPSGAPTTKKRQTHTATRPATNKRNSSSWLHTSLTTADRARVADIGSAHIPQIPQPDPPTFRFSFCAMGASLVDAAASSTTSGSSPTELFPKPAAPALSGVYICVCWPL